MRSLGYCVAIGLVMIAALVGCWRSTNSIPGGGPPPVWVEKEIEHAGMTLSLGYRGDAPQAGKAFEPVAMITRDGRPVADAMVFVSLLDGAEADAGEDQATVYEISQDRKAGHYAQGELQAPAGAQSCTVRFRIVFADAQEDWTRDVEMPVQ